MKIYIFNPENDLALADFRIGYTAPASARRMRQELYWLPSWWAEDEDLVWDGRSPLSLSAGDEIVPWGWSPALVHELRNAGVAQAFLPGEVQLGQLRALSSRATAVEALSQLRRDGVARQWLCGESVVCRSLGTLRAAAGGWEQTMMKMPWSGSGKGLRLYSAPDAERWAARTIAQQGCVVAERWLHRMVDFALEYVCDGQGGVAYRGLSLFFTNANGAYQGNWLAPEAVKRAWLGQYLADEIFDEVCAWWTDYLRRFNYRGPVGIDMMLAQEGVCPCVEINWRMTMGMASVLLAEQGRSGKLLVGMVHGRYMADIEDFG